ncbi:MAG: response regulator transcription factor [Pseudomonadota bacterium]
MRIVVVEDNESLRKGIAYRLQDDGHSVDALADGLQAADFLRQEACDLVVLDIHLPGQNGLALLRDLRKRGDPRPVILLTARSTTEDRVEGLDAGADDYLVKPFAMEELAARVRALSRRKAVAPRRRIEVAALTLLLEPLQLMSGATPLDVPRRELAVFAALAEAGGAVVSKEQLLDRVYGTGSATDDKVIEVYVSRLRKRLEPYDIAIRVVRSIGYALVAPGP